MKAGHSVIRYWSRWLLISFYLFAGSNHFIHPNFYLPLIPDYLLFHALINWISGAVEIVLAIGVAFRYSRGFSANALVLLLLLFIPAHIHFIQLGSCVPAGLCVANWVAWLRLLIIHPLLIWWAWEVGKDGTF